jgi:hypothetical protein
MSRGAGVYRVESITQHPSRHPGKTFVQLERITKWTSDAPKSPKIEFSYGPTPNRGYIGQGGLSIEISTGEKLGVILKWHQSHYVLTNAGVFRQHGSEVRNDYRLFKGKGLSFSDVGDKVRKIYDAKKDGKDCPFNVKPTPRTGNPADNDMKDGDDEWDGERQTQEGY